MYVKNVKGVTLVEWFALIVIVGVIVTAFTRTDSIQKIEESHFMRKCLQEQTVDICTENWKKLKSLK